MPQTLSIRFIMTTGICNILPKNVKMAQRVAQTILLFLFSFSVLFTKAQPIDREPPVVVNCPSNINLGTAPFQSCYRIVTWTEPTAVDNVSGPLTYFSRTVAPGSQFGIGTSTVTYVFRDAAGNEARCSFTVQIFDNTAPVINCIENVTRTINASNTYTIPELTASN